MCAGTAALLVGGGPALARLGRAVPVTPPDGAQISELRPLLRWSLPAGERSVAVTIARAPATEGRGALSARAAVERRRVNGPDRATRPAGSLPAGRYWWQVETRDAAGERAFSRLRMFRIPVRLAVVDISTSAYAAGRPIAVHVAWRGNVRRATLTLRLVHAGRVVWSTMRSAPTSSLDGLSRTTFTVPPGVNPAPGRATFRVSLFAST
jgi:hypothetical protein